MLSGLLSHPVSISTDISIINTFIGLRIKTVKGEGVLRKRLLDLGLTPGTIVMVRRTAPMGDPIQLHLRGYELTLRRSEAEKMEIQEVFAEE